MRSRLQALRTPSLFVAGAKRVIAQPVGKGQVAAILKEINETLLGRTLQFETANGASLAFEVAGRRLLRIASLTGFEPGIDLRSVSTLDDSHLTDLAALITGFAPDGSEIRVVSAPIGRKRDGSGDGGVSVGLPVALVAEKLKVSLNQEEPELPSRLVPRIIALTGDAVLAWVWQSGDDLQHAGPEEMVSHLTSFLADEAEAVNAQLDLLAVHPDQPVCAVIGTDARTGPCILGLRADGGVLIGVIGPGGLTALLSAWNSAVI